MPNNTVFAKGIPTIKDGKSYKVTPIMNGQLTIHSGWWLNVRDDNGYYETGFVVKTQDETTAKQLNEATASGKQIVVEGSLKNENWDKDKKRSTNGVWVTVLYVTSAEIVD